MKEYAVNITLNGEAKVYDNDHYDWHDNFDAAYTAAKEAMQDAETAEVNIYDCEDGDFGDLDITLIREDGMIREYRDGEPCWL